MSEIIRNAFKALEDLVDDVKMEPVKRKKLNEAIVEDTVEKEETALEDQTIKDLFVEAGSYVLTKEFEKDGLPYFLFVEGTSEGDAADIKFDEFNIDNVDGFLVEILDEERNFVDDITLKDIKGSLEEAEGDEEEEVKEISDLETPVEKVIEVAKEQIDTFDEASVAEESLKENFKMDKKTHDDIFWEIEDKVLQGEIKDSSDLYSIKVNWDNVPMEEIKKIYNEFLAIKKPKKEETLQPTGFNESAGTSKFFPGGDGDIPAAEFVQSNKLKDYRIEWDNEKDGYLISWGPKPVEESAKEGVQKLKKIKKLSESQHFSLRDKDELQKAKEVVTDNKEEEPVEQIVDVNAETVDDLKKSYIGSTILQCPVCRTMIYKDPKDLVKPEGETAEGEKLYNIGESCPHCGAKDGFELIGQVASLDVNPQQQPEPPMVEPKPEELKPEEVKPEGEKPVEQPKEEKPVETIEPVSSEEKPQEEQPQEEQPVDLVPQEETEDVKPEEKDEKKKKPRTSKIAEEPVKEELKEATPAENPEKNWGVRQDVEYKVFKSRPELVLGFVIKDLTKEEAEKKAKEMNTEQLNKSGIFYRVAEMEEKKDMKEKYEDVVLESFDEAKFDRLAKKYLNEVYENIESYVTRHAALDNKANKVFLEGLITFKSGKTKDTKFVFEAREITKKGKLKFVGVNETFTTKKAFTLVGQVEGKNMLSESLTYSYKLNDKKVYGQVKNPTKR